MRNGGSVLREDRLAELAAEINENRMGTLRVAKALVQFARAAGLGLLEARKLIGEEGFAPWLKQALGLTPPVAEALIHYSQQPEVRTADVSPMKDVPLVGSLGACRPPVRSFSPRASCDSGEHDSDEQPTVRAARPALLRPSLRDRLQEYPASDQEETAT